MIIETHDHRDRIVSASFIFMPCLLLFLLVVYYIYIIINVVLCLVHGCD